MTPLGSAQTNSEYFIDYTRIEPLVLDKIVVKAKKLKEVKMENMASVEKNEHEHEEQGEDMDVE